MELCLLSMLLRVVMDGKTISKAAALCWLN